MTFKIGVVRGASKDEVLKSKFDIYIGISLHNQFFTKENLRACIIWALKHTKERVGVVIADTLHAINYHIQSNYSMNAAIRKALKEGDKFVEIINAILKELPESDKHKIDIIRWDDVRKDREYPKLFEFFDSQFKKNEQFKQEIREIVLGYIVRTGKTPSDEKLDALCSYIIDEFPEVLNGFTYKSTRYNCCIYPNDGSLQRLTEQIQKGEKFPEFREKLKIEGNVFVEGKVE